MSKGSKGRNRRWCGTPRGCLTVERAPVDLHESDEAEKAAELAARAAVEAREAEEERERELAKHAGQEAPPMDSLHEKRMVQRAARDRWPIPEKYREAVANEMVRIAIDRQNTQPRERVAAGRAVVAMVGQNQSDEHKALPDTVIHKLGYASEDELDGVLVSAMERLAGPGAGSQGQDVIDVEPAGGQEDARTE